MKRFFLLIIGLLAAAVTTALAAYEYTMRVTVTQLVDHKNNFIIVSDFREQWLIHHGSGCSGFENGDEVTLVVHGEMDGIQETLWPNPYDSCMVDVVAQITGTLTVTTVSASDTSTSVSDDGLPYRIYYSERCKDLKGLNGQDIYVRKFGQELRTGDIIYMPGTAEACAITYAYKEEPAEPPPPPPEGLDLKRPTTPTNFRAIPSTTAVYLYWNEAEDNVGIRRYVISASLYHHDDPVAQDPTEKPQTLSGELFYTETNRPSYKLTNLLPDELYFFRVIAEDTSGNLSSYWSNEGTAFTKSSIIEREATDTTPLRIFQAQETDTSFLFRWNHEDGWRYSVALEVDNDRVFASTNWWRSYIQIAKKPERKGKKLELTVRAIDIRGQVQSEKVIFSF